MRAFEVKQDRCRVCLKCMQVCPIHAVELQDGAVRVEDSRCVNCGLCYQHCPHGAIDWEDQTGMVREFIRAGRKVIFSFDPAIYGLLPEGVLMEQMAAAVKKLGACGAADASEAAAAVASEYGRLIRERHSENFILTHCPVVRNLVEQHWPELLEDLIPVTSPMIAHGRMLKRDFPNAAVVYVTVCAACTLEMRDVRHSTEINAVLTWPQLQAWLRAEGIAPAACEAEPLLGESGGKGKLGALPGGMLEPLRDYADPGAYRCLAAQGMNACKSALKAMRSGQLHRCILDLSACEGGCMGGAAGGLDLVDCYTKGLPLGMEASAAKMPEPDIRGIAMATPAISRFGIPFDPDEVQIQAMLNHIGVGNPQKQADCGRCGFPTCRERAKAILWGRDNVNLCINAVEEAMRGVYRQLYDQLPLAVLLVDDTQKVVGFNREAAGIFLLRENEEKYIFELMDPGDFQYVMNTGLPIRSRQIDLPEFFMKAEVQLVPLKSLGLVAGIFRDITDQENREAERLSARLESVDIAQKLIEKQMTVAQEIAFLLGETTAETKVTLNQLKQRIMEEDEV